MAEDPLDPLRDGQRTRGDVVIELADIRIARGMPRFGAAVCRHRQMLYDSKDRRIWCQDCERTIDAFDAFSVLVQHFGGMAIDAARKQKRAEEALAHTARLRATRALDQVWGSNAGRLAPCCPHCRRGLLPEDFADDAAACISRDLEIARRRKEPTPHGGTTG